MSLDYESLFSEIDKAKKKRKRWTQADTDKWAEQQKEEREKKPRVSQPKYTDGKESDSRGRTFGSLGEYSSGGVAGQEKQRHHSTSKKPTSVRIGDLEERESTEDEKKLGQVSPHGEEENPNTKNLPKYSEREERSGMMGKPHKERKRRDTEESLARIEADTEERRKKLKERREQEKTESERKENEKKQNEEWDDNKLLQERSRTNPRTPHPKKRRTPDYGTVSGEEKLGEEPSGMFGSKGHPRKKPKEETEAQYKKIRARMDAMDKDPYIKPTSAVSGKKIGIDAKERTGGDKEIKVDSRINEPTPKKDFIGPSRAMTPDEKELARKKFPNPAFAYPETTVGPSPQTGIKPASYEVDQSKLEDRVQRGTKEEQMKEIQRKIIAARGVGPPESKEKPKKQRQHRNTETARPWNKPQSKRITDPYDYREVAEDTLRDTIAEKPKKPINPNNPKQLKLRKRPKKRKTPKYMMDENFDVKPYEPGQDKDDDDDLESEYDGTVGKALWKAWLEKKDCPNCGKKRMGKKTKLLWNFITQPPDIYPSEIDGIGDDEEEDEVEKSLWKAWLKIKAEEGIGGMNMGSQRGLGHEAGYKQDPGQTAQITEVKEEKDKSAYEVYEQNETPETEPTKRQIPHSKPKMDTFKSLYKKALIVKYKNIYKPLNT